jgi:two-component system NtrC family sensor kinase
LPGKQGEDRCIAVAATDEIGAMAGSINRMVRELDSRKEELQANADLYRIVTEFSSDMATWETPEGTIRYVSPNCLAITGYADHEFRADPSLFDGIVHPDDRALWQRYLVAWIDDAERVPIEIRIVAKDGQVRWVGHASHRIYNERGEYLGIRGSYRDITERMEVDEVLRKLSLAVEQNPCSIVITDMAGSIEYVNPRFCEITGYSLAEVVGQNTRLLKSGAHGDELYREMWETISAGGEWRGEFQNKTKDGRLYWVLASISPIRSVAGDITHYIAINEEITARKQAEAALRKSQAELQVKHEQLMVLYAQVELGKHQWEQTLDCINDGVLLVDRDDAVVRCNKAVAELAGMPLKEIRGASWRELLLGPTVDASRFDGENGELFDTTSGRWFIVRSYPYAGSGGAGAGRVITLHDTTAIKRASAELQDAYNELKLTQAHILQQEKMASIGQLAAGVAHEINNPIGFVGSNLGTLGKYLDRVTDYLAYQADRVADRALDELAGELAERRKALKLDYVMGDARQLIAESLDGTDRVRQIVQNLKSFSRVDEAEFKFAQINDCLESTLNIVWNELKYKAAVNREYGDLPPTKCYPQQLNQVFMNLLVNAAHAIEKQGEITVRSWSADGYVSVAVRDSGCGIPPDNLSHIFEPFFTTKEVGKGTGLGLSISYDIVKKHNGEILVDSLPGEGTTFTVKIPVIGQ